MTGYEANGAYAVVKEIFEEKPELIRLMTKCTGEISDEAESDESFEHLIEANLILFDPESALKSSDGVRCILLAGQDEQTLDMVIFCYHSQWMLHGYEQRAVEIARLIWDAVDGKICLDGDTLHAVSFSTQVLSDDLSYISISFDTDEPLDDDPFDNPFTDHAQIFKRITEELIHQEKTADFLELSDGDDGEACLRKGLIRFNSCLTRPETGYELIQVTMEGNRFSGTSLDLAAFIWNSGDSDADLRRLKQARDGIRMAMTSIPGVSNPRPTDPTEVGVAGYAVFFRFDFKYDKASFDGKSKPQMNRPNFFLNQEAMSSLLDLPENPEAPVFDFTIDLTDMPYQLFCLYEEDQDVLKVKLRMELMGYEEPELPKATLVKPHDADQVNVTMDEENDALLNALTAFYLVGNRIRAYVAAHNLLDEIRDAVPDREGLLLELKEGQLAHRVVKGSDRPDLLCSTFFGGMRMMRPYAEDVMNDFAMEDSSLEDLTEAAEDGDTKAIDKLGLMYLNGDEVDADPEKAVYWFRKGAEMGITSHLFNLGLFYAKGFGVERDFRKAAEWMKKASEAGDEDAESLADEYQELAAAAEKAEAGDAQAQADLAAGIMKLGNSLDQADSENDYAESLKWAKKAAEQKNGKGLWVLALAYEHGRGVEKDEKQALAYYEQGAELGNAACQHSLGCMYMKGDTVAKGCRKAFELFQKAAMQGYGLAMKDLGRCYQFAKGTTGNMGKAIEWYEKSLAVLPDPELAQKVEVFKQLAEIDPDFNDDYPEEDDNNVRFP